MAQETHLAFFSYSRDDSEFVMKLATDLKAAGGAVWLDQLDIRAGQHWDKTVEEALANCANILLVLSPSSVSSSNVMDEVSFALDEKKLIIPVLYRTCKIPLRLRRIQYIDVRTDYANALKEMLRLVAPDEDAKREREALKREQQARLAAEKEHSFGAVQPDKVAGENAVQHVEYKPEQTEIERRLSKQEEPLARERAQTEIAQTSRSVGTQAFLGALQAGTKHWIAALLLISVVALLGGVWYEVMTRSTQNPMHRSSTGSGRAATNPGTYGTCTEGYVWREASPSDHVCVTPAVRDQTATENESAAARRMGSGPDGPDTCKYGYVWREAFPDDHVCVEPSSRTQAARDNREAQNRMRDVQ